MSFEDSIRRAEHETAARKARELEAKQDAAQVAAGFFGWVAEFLTVAHARGIGPTNLAQYVRDRNPFTDSRHKTQLLPYRGWVIAMPIEDMDSYSPKEQNAGFVVTNEPRARFFRFDSFPFTPGYPIMLNSVTNYSFTPVLRPVITKDRFDEAMHRMIADNTR